MKSSHFEALHLENMASFLSSNGCISANFDNIHPKLSTHYYFEVRFHSILSKYENSKNIFMTSSLMNSFVNRTL